MKVEVHAGEFETQIDCVGCRKQRFKPVTALNQEEARKTAEDEAIKSGWEDRPEGALCPACLTVVRDEDDEEVVPRDTRAARMSKTRSTKILRRRKDGDEEG